MDTDHKQSLAYQACLTVLSRMWEGEIISYFYPDLLYIILSLYFLSLCFRPWMGSEETSLLAKFALSAPNALTQPLSSFSFSFVELRRTLEGFLRIYLCLNKQVYKEVRFLLSLRNVFLKSKQSLAVPLPFLREQIGSIEFYNPGLTEGIQLISPLSAQCLQPAFVGFKTSIGYLLLAELLLSVLGRRLVVQYSFPSDQTILHVPGCWFLPAVGQSSFSFYCLSLLTSAFGRVLVFFLPLCYPTQYEKFWIW